MMPMLTTLAHAILGRTPDPAALPLKDETADAVATLRYAIARGTGGAEGASHDTRVHALRGLEAMEIRHPARLAKILEASGRDTTHLFRAVGVLAEYARTRRTDES